MLDMQTLASIVVYGVFLGLVYALMSVGISIIFGLMKLINFAHGEIYMMGGYSLYYFVTAPASGAVAYFVMTARFSSIYGLPVAFVVGFALGSLIESVLIRPTYTTRMEKTSEYAIIVTFGLSLFLQNFALYVFGFHFKAPEAFWPGNISVGLFSVARDVVFTSCMSVVILVLLFLFINRTWMGLSLKANSQNLVGAQLAGIRAVWTNNLGFALGSGLAAVAGALLGPTYLVYPTMGSQPVLTAFTVVVLGGLGSLEGAVIASLLVGISYSVLGVVISPSYANIYGFVILLIVLAIRPRGLFGQKERTY